MSRGRLAARTSDAATVDQNGILAMQVKSNPKLLLEFAEVCLSDVAADKYDDALFVIAPNPFEIGRKRQKEMWRRIRIGIAERLIWC